MDKPATPQIALYYPAPAAPLSEEELDAVFRQIGRNDAVWVALMQLLQQRLADATMAAAEADPHAAGRLQEIAAIQSTLARYRQGREARGKARA